MTEDPPELVEPWVPVRMLAAASLTSTRLRFLVASPPWMSVGELMMSLRFGGVVLWEEEDMGKQQRSLSKLISVLSEERRGEG